MNRSQHTPAQAQGLPQCGFIRAKRFAAALDIGESTLWKWAAENRIPQPIKLSPRVTVWDAAAVHEWMTRRTAVLQK
jgi:prophage regulatory protein